MTATNIIVGVEIECIYNKSILPRLNIGPYMDPTPTPGLAGWKLSSDGSLHLNWLQPEFPNYSTVEFISSKAMGKKMFFNYLNDFKKFVSKNGTHELKEVLTFNNSCGCHMHFSIKDFRFQNKVYYMQFPKVRKFFFDKIKASNIKSKNEILNHYNRSMARKFQYTDMTIKRTRRCEFNFRSEDEGTGLELRGVNLLGIDTWAEFDEVFNIIWDTLEYLYECAIKWNYNFCYAKNGKQILSNQPLLIQQGKIKTEIDLNNRIIENGIH